MGGSASSPAVARRSWADCRAWRGYSASPAERLCWESRAASRRQRAPTAIRAAPRRPEPEGPSCAASILRRRSSLCCSQGYSFKLTHYPSAGRFLAMVCVILDLSRTHIQTDKPLKLLRNSGSTLGAFRLHDCLARTAGKSQHFPTWKGASCSSQVSVFVGEWHLFFTCYQAAPRHLLASTLEPPFTAPNPLWRHDKGPAIEPPQRLAPGPRAYWLEMPSRVLRGKCRASLGVRSVARHLPGEQRRSQALDNAH